jgi:predicted glycosyl hydrolase (DUF1957 family)
VSERRSHSFSFDITNSLVNQLPTEFVERLSVLYQSKLIEPVATCANHYLLPLVMSHRDVISDQLVLNKAMLAERITKGLGTVKGVFPPEMAFHPNLVPHFRDLGFEWGLYCDRPFRNARCGVSEHFKVPMNWVVTSDKFPMILRSFRWSDQVAFEHHWRGDRLVDTLVEGQKQWRKDCGNYDGDSFVLIALDAENFGHHHPKDQLQRLLRPFYDRIGERNDCELVPIQNILDCFSDRREYYVPPGSWSTDSVHVPYPLWGDPKNNFHVAWNKFMNTSLAHYSSSEGRLKKILQRAFCSCYPWNHAVGKGDVASWCLPELQEIVDLFPSGETKLQLGKLFLEVRSQCG